MIFSVLAFITLIISICIKDRKRSLCVQSLNCLFESIIIINCLYTWQGFISLLPTIGSIIRTYCLWQSNMKLVRISGITTGLLYGSYYIYYSSWFMVLGDVVLLVTGIYVLLKNDINIRRKI